MGPTKSSPLSQCPLAEAVAVGEGNARWKISDFRGFKVIGRSSGLRSKLPMFSLLLMHWWLLKYVKVVKPRRWCQEFNRILCSKPIIPYHSYPSISKPPFMRYIPMIVTENPGGWILSGLEHFSVESQIWAPLNHEAKDLRDPTWRHLDPAEAQIKSRKEVICHCCGRLEGLHETWCSLGGALVKLRVPRSGLDLARKCFLDLELTCPRTWRWRKCWQLILIIIISSSSITTITITIIIIINHSGWVYIYMCVCVCMYMYIYNIYTRIYIHIYILHTHTYIYIHILERTQTLNQPTDRTVVARPSNCDSGRKDIGSPGLEGGRFVARPHPSTSNQLPCHEMLAVNTGSTLQ